MKYLSFNENLKKIENFNYVKSTRKPNKQKTNKNTSVGNFFFNIPYDLNVYTSMQLFFLI